MSRFDLSAPKLTRQQAAELCGVDPRTIDRAIKSGALAAYRPGKNVLIFQHDLEAWFVATRIRPVRARRRKMEIHHAA